jgi:hypothetical protein
MYKIGEITSDAGINKNAAVRNYKKEKHFFKGQVIQFDTADIGFIKTPYPFGSKVNIPNNV